ncbi:hypothetical protein BHE74_00032482 [Ensete ventricosum]|nr:hypothetical protein BHE74_00032482 [Ensete ventricosum]RZR90006.1 hypothetical protein BHM03_00017826 [Ensete ventricosum]
MPGSIAFALVGSIELTKAPISASQPPLHDFPNPNPTGDSVADISSLLPLSLLFVAAVVVTIAACRCRYRCSQSIALLNFIFQVWFKVIDKDHGVLMRPMPGMVGLVPSGSKYDVKFFWSKMLITCSELSTMKLIMTLSSYGLVRLLSTDLFNFSLQQFLKEILNDLCVYNKRGPNQGTHELKPEYKKSTEEMDNV